MASQSGFESSRVVKPVTGVDGHGPGDSDSAGRSDVTGRRWLQSRRRRASAGLGPTVTARPAAVAAGSDGQLFFATERAGDPTMTFFK